MSIESADRRQSDLLGAADGSSAELPSLKASRPPLLLPIVFVTGITEMAIQMCASRFVQTHFGSSILIWSNLIGVTMICMALGYSIGGRLSDRSPRPALLYQLTGATALWMFLIPLINEPILNLTQGGGLFIGSMLGIILLFALPLTLLGCVSPFAVRLLLRNVQGAGRTAGMVSSLSTTGSILGTFLPVLFFIPTIGTRLTLYLFAALLLAISVIGLLWTRRNTAALTQPEPTREVKPSTAATPKNKLTTELMPFLLPIVFICGMAVLATEMCASRLIQPYFGDSQLIWAFLIGFIIIFLAIGYFIGGRLGDRFPRPAFLYQLTGLAAFSMGLIPIASRPILTLSSEGFKNADGLVFFGSLLIVILMFAVPVILLGCVSPFATRLLMYRVQDAGRTVGRVNTYSTIGSILGTFLPVLLFIPLIGTRETLYLFSLVLLGFSSVGLFLTRSRRTPVFAALMVGVLLLSLLVTITIKPPSNGVLLADQESAYNYIQVVQRTNNQIDLVLNEGHAVHSIYNPNQILTGGPWDYYMVTPFFNKGVTEKDVKSALLLGLGAGTVPKQLTKAYGSQIHVDGVEIDPAIIDLGRRYFAMTEPNLTAIAEDGRYQLNSNTNKYDIIGVDAYKQPYIPFHLTTVEFFRQVRDHLTANGVAVINAGTPAVNNKIDHRLAEALAQTMKQVYPNVYMIDLYSIAGYFNTIVVATNQPTELATFKTNISQVVTNDLIKTVGSRAIDKNSVKEWTGLSDDGTRPTFFTDDLAPVERLIDQVIIDYVTSGGK